MNNIKFIANWNDIVTKHLNDINNFIDDDFIKNISTDYIKSKTSNTHNISFNAFRLASDRYYQEDYHSDILRAILDPFSGHGEGSTYLALFLNMIGVNQESYEDARVIREKGRIDILIKSDNHKRAIIIENKINNAYDTINQIPKYYSLVKDWGFQVDKIVYIPLDNNNTPDKTTWNTNYFNEILECLEIIPALSNNNGKSISRWIESCTLQSNNIDNISILRQYSKLIKYLRGEIMDSIILEKFHKELLQGDNFKYAISIKNMLNDLPSYLAQKIHDIYKNNHSPFGNIFIWSSTDCVFEKFILGDYSFKCDIWCHQDYYNVKFWEQNRNVTCNVIDTFSGVESLSDFQQNPNEIYSMSKRFEFNEYDKVIEFINNLLVQLSEKQKVY